MNLSLHAALAICGLSAAGASWFGAAVWRGGGRTRQFSLTAALVALVGYFLVVGLLRGEFFYFYLVALYFAATLLLYGQMAIISREVLVSPDVRRLTYRLLVLGRQARLAHRVVTPKPRVVDLRDLTRQFAWGWSAVLAQMSGVVVYKGVASWGTIGHAAACLGAVWALDAFARSNFEKWFDESLRVRIAVTSSLLGFFPLFAVSGLSTAPFGDRLVTEIAGGYTVSGELMSVLQGVALVAGVIFGAWLFVPSGHQAQLLACGAPAVAWILIGPILPRDYAVVGILLTVTFMLVSCFSGLVARLEQRQPAGTDSTDGPNP